MKNIIITLCMLLPLGLFWACSKSDESLENQDEVIDENEATYEITDLTEAEIEYVSLESLPEWLKSWVISTEEKSGIPNTVFREEYSWDVLKLYRGKWEGTVIYYIHNDTNSCIICDCFSEDGKRLELDMEQFTEATHHMKRIYLK